MPGTRKLGRTSDSRNAMMRSPRFHMYQQINRLFHGKQSYFYLILALLNPNLLFLFQNVSFPSKQPLFQSNRLLQFATLRTAKACGIQDIGVKGKGQSLLGAGSLQRQLDHTVQKLFVRNAHRIPQIECQ